MDYKNEFLETVHEFREKAIIDARASSAALAANAVIETYVKVTLT